MADGEKTWKIRKRKTARYSAEKRLLSESEHKRVVRIPLIVWLRPIVVEPHVVFVVVEVEHVRIAVGVGDSRDTPSRTPPAQNGARLYSIGDRKSRKRIAPSNSFL